MEKLIFAAVLLSLLVGCSKQPQSIEELTKAGEKAFIDQKYATARKYLTQVVAQKPSDRRLLYLLGISYQRDYLYDSAFHYLKRADLLFPDDREINIALYGIAKKIKEWKSAIRAINVLVQTGDPIGQYYGELGELNIKLENYPVAYYFYRKLLEKEPDKPNNYLQVANLAAQIDSTHVALAVVDSALERFGPRDEFLLNKGLYLAAQRRYAESENIMRTLVAKDTATLAFKLNLANVLASQDDRAKKLEAYQLYLQLKAVVSDKFRLDSLIGALREELNIEH